MADIKIVKLKIRRGTDSQRRTTLLDQGELGYTTDTKRLFVGNGVLSGGLNLGTKVHPPLTNYYSLSTLNAETGDLVIANNLFYQLTGSNYNVLSAWANVSQKFDTTQFSFNGSNVVSIPNNSLDPIVLQASKVNGGLVVDGLGLYASLNNGTLALTAGQIGIRPGGVGPIELNSTAAGTALSGGNGVPFGVRFDPSTLYLKGGNTLAVSAFPAGSVTFSSLDSSWFGTGLIVDTPNQKIKTVVSDVDSSTIFKDVSGRISLLGGAIAATNELPYIQSDVYGRVVLNRSSIYDTVSCLSSTDMGPLSSIFTGTPNQSLSGGLGLPITTFTVLSSNATGTTALTLSSAGFILFQGNTTARADGKYVGRFAIPVFAY